MPPKIKKGRKAKTPKGPPEKLYEFLTLDEMNGREQKYANRLNDLRVCLNFIDDALIQVEHLNEMQLIADKWHDFITCNPLPKPYLPPNIRLFFTKLKFFESKNLELNIDWPLAVEERSILSQNIFRQDLTRTYLKGKLKPEFGLEYNRNINDCLNVIRRIEYFFDNDVQVAKCPLSVLADVQQRKLAIQEEILEFFDCYTYRILCSEEAYMTSIDSVSTEYCFSGDHFQMHIWSLKNVPIRFSHLDEPRLLADLHEVRILLHIPSTMLHENLTIRAIRMNFDHVSENAKSFSQLITVPVDNLNAGIQDLHECLINEWLMQLDIQSRVREELVAKRLEYEEKLRLFEEEQAKKSKKNQKSEGDKKSKQPKILKPTKEPPIMPLDAVPDVYQDFLEEEQKQYQYFINTIYNPESLDLDSDEINLKKFFILGGVYQLFYVTKPEHSDFDFDRFNMTWHHNDSKLQVGKDIFIPSTSRYLSRRTTRLMSHMSLKRLSRAEQPKDASDPECPWFVLTITLPEYLCYWGEPMACHYETIEKVLEQKEVEECPIALPTPRKGKGIRRLPSSTSLSKLKPTINDGKALLSSMNSEVFPLQRSFTQDMGGSIMKLRRLNASQRLSQGNFFQSSLSLRISHADILRKARSSDGTLNIEDFHLSFLLNKAQIRHLEGHCLPRIISSFKFPQEIREEELEAFRRRPKSKGGTLIRKQTENTDDINDKSIKRVFSYNDSQNNPERIFVIYPREELIRVLSHLQDEDEAHEPTAEPETFLELIKLLNSIKNKYKQRVYQIVHLKPFKSKMKWQNKRLKHFFKKYERKPLQASVSAERNVGQNKAGKRVAPKTKVDNLKTSMGSESKRDLRRDVSKVHIVEPTHSDVQELSVFEPSTDSQYRNEKNPAKEPQTIRYSHWTTRHILSSDYDKEKRTIVIQTDRLGYIGFAFKRYEHFPFKYWSLEPSEEDPENEVVFTLETQYVRCVLFCTPNGIRGHVTEPTRKFVRNPKMYLVIEKPMKDYKEFKKMFKDNYLNIFAEHDACYYIENGYFSEKHLATEMHTYCCMAVHSTQMKFQFSQWNRLSQRRDIILKFVQFKDLPDNLVEVRITPEEAFFVEISELCSDDLEIIKLHYSPTWRNIGSYTDLHHLINSMYPAATDLRCKNPKLISCIRDLLNEIRPLSFS